MSPRDCPERIVVLTSSYPAHADDPSGHFVAAEVARLRELGHHVLVLAPDVRRDGAAPPPGVRWLPSGDAFGWPGFLARVRERPLRLSGGVSFVHAARTVLRASAPWDRLIAHFVLPCVWPVLDWLPRPGRAVEAVAHGSDVRLLARLPAPIRRRVARLLDGCEIRCASAELERTLIGALGSGIAGRIRVEPPSLDVSVVFDRNGARRRLDLPASAKIAVVMGRLIAKKRVDVALRAARLVPHLRVVVVGDGPERGALERAFPEARFVGLVGRSDALSWLAAANVLLVASREEGASCVVREARALGTPVVALASGDLGTSPSANPRLWVVGGEPGP